MKLAEALILRSEIRKRMTLWKERARTSVKVQEGDQPTEQSAELFAEWDNMVAEFTALSTQINRTNIRATLPGGATLMEAIAERDALTLRASGLNTAIGLVTEGQPRFGRAEIKTVVLIDVAATRRKIEEIARQRRELDAKIQATNWLTELEA